MHQVPITNATPLSKDALQSFFGIGPAVSRRIMAKYYIHERAKVGTLVNKQVLDLGTELSTMTLENDLRRRVVDNIRRLRDMGTYRGRRHAMGLPVRGQTTRSQVQTQLSWPNYCFWANRSDLLLYIDTKCKEIQ